MEIKRDYYLKLLIQKQHNGLTKVITGIRRCGKSYLLRTIFKNYLLQNGVKPENIIELSLDEVKNSKYRNPLLLDEYLRSFIKSSKTNYYFLLDEIQLVKPVKNPAAEGDLINFAQVLIGLSNQKNCDVYVTGSNSKFLAKDIVTEFRGKNDQIKMFPLTFKEFSSVKSLSPEEAFKEYLIYGGLPATLTLNDRAKEEYLKSLFTETYNKDLIERYQILRQDVLNLLLDFISSSLSSLTNPSRIASTLNQTLVPKVSVNTITEYLKYLEECFLINTARRYDIKGKKYFDFPNKYYFTDPGLRNARLNFRQIDPGHLMEDVVYNELISRGYAVDIGVVYDSDRKQREIDFVVNDLDRRYYLQCAYEISENNLDRETAPLKNTRDFYQKICLRNDLLRNYYDDDGIYHESVIDFLLDKDALEK